MAFKPFVPSNSTSTDLGWGFNSTPKVGVGIDEWAKQTAIFSPQPIPVEETPIQRTLTGTKYDNIPAENFKPISDSAQYTKSTFDASLARTGATILDLPNLAKRALVFTANTISRAGQTIFKAFGDKTPYYDIIKDDTTLYSNLMNASNVIAGKQTQTYGDNPIVANILSGAQKQEQKVAELDSKVNFGTKILASTLASIPTNISWMASAAAGVPALGAAISVGQALQKEAPMGSGYKKTAFAFASGAIDAATEYIFDLWKWLKPLPKGMGTFGDVAETAVSKYPTLVRASYEMLKSAGGEGAEELIAYPFQQLLEWRMNNPDKTASEFYDAKKFFSEWGYAGLAGFAGGALFGSFGTVHNMRVDSINRKIMEAKTKEIAETPIDQLTSEQVAEFTNLVSDAIIDGAGFDAVNSIAQYEEQKQAQSTMPQESLAEPSTEFEPVQTENIITDDAKGVETAVEPVYDNVKIEQPISSEERTQKVSRRKEVIAEMKDIVDKNGSGLSGNVASKYVALGKELSELTFALKPKLNVEKLKSKSDRKSTLDTDIIVSARNDKYKNKDVYMALEESVHGVYANKDTPVDDIMNGKNDNISAVEFYNLFDETRNKLRKQYGDTITLYRSEGKQKAKATKNYVTTQEAVQEYLDTQESTGVTKVEVPIENIIAVEVGNGNYHEIIVGNPPITSPQTAETKEPIVKKGRKIISHGHRGGGLNAAEYGGTFVDDYFVARMPDSREASYGIYDKTGYDIRGGFDKASEAIEYVKNAITSGKPVERRGEQYTKPTSASNANAAEILYNNGYRSESNPNATLDEVKQMFEKQSSVGMIYVAPQTAKKVTQEAKKEEKAEPKRTLEQEIDDIVNSAMSVEEATQSLKNKLKANPEILDELRKSVTNKEELAMKLLDIKNQMQLHPSMFNSPLSWKMKLNLLSLQEYALRVLDVPENSRPYSFMGNMVKYLGKTVDEQDMSRLNAEMDEIFYEQLHNKDVVEDAKSIMDSKDKGKKLDELYNRLTLKQTIDGKKVDFVLEPHEMVALGLWTRELISSDDGENIIKANEIIRKLSNRMTTAGQFTQAAKVLYETLYPEMISERIAKEVENQNKKSELEDLKNQVKRLMETITKLRNEAGKAAVKRIIDDSDTNQGDVKDVVLTKEQKKTPAEILKARIEADLKGRKGKERTDLQKQIETLFRIYKETNKTTAKETDVYKAISDMVMNRREYADTWDKAKALILKENADNPALVDYFNRLADPTMTASVMNKVISETFKSMGKSANDLARAYFVTDGANVKEFLDILRTNMSEIDDASFEYLSTHLKAQFTRQMEERRTRMIDALNRQYDETGKRIIRKEPQGHKERVINQLIDASFKQALDISSVRQAWADRMGLTTIDDATKAIIYSRMKEIAQISDEEAKENAFDDLLKEIAGKLEGSNYDKFLAWRRFAMLFSPVSWIKNGVSNIASLPFYKATDAIEKFLNNMAGEDIKAERRIAGEKFLAEGKDAQIDEVVDYYSTPSRMERMIESSAKYTIGKIISAEKRIFGNSKTEKWTKLPYNVMSKGKIDVFSREINIPFLGDQYMFKRHFKTALRNRLNAVNYSQITDEATKKMEAKKAADEAYEVAIIRTYRKLNALSAWIMKVKNKNITGDIVKSKLAKGDIAGAKRAENIGVALNAVMDVVMPFVTTPLAIAEEAFKFSPIYLAVETASLAGWQIKKAQLAKAGIPITSEMQDKLSALHHGLAQALSGTIGQFAVGIILGLMGILTGAPPDEEKEKLEWAQTGKRAYSIYIKGIGSLSLDWMQPVSMVLGMGAELGQQMANKDFSIEKMGDAVFASLDSLANSTVLADLQSTIGGGYNTSLVKTIGDVMISGAMQGLPGIARRISRVFDPYERDIYTGNSFNVIKNRIMSHIPFVSMLIPPKVDIWGNPVKQIAGMNNIVGILPRTITNLLSPFMYKGADRDPLTVEVSRLFESTSESSALPIVPSDSITVKIKNQEYTLDLKGSDWADYQKLFGQKMYEYANEVVASSRYAKATDTDRVKLIKSAYAVASADAKEEYIKAYFKLP